MPLKDGEGAQSAACPLDSAENRGVTVFGGRRSVPGSKMFDPHNGLLKFRAKHPGETVYDGTKQGDGGKTLAGISAEELAGALVRFLPLSHPTEYGPPGGRDDVCRSVYECYYGLEPLSGIGHDQVVMTDGGRDALQKWCQAVVDMTGITNGYLVVGAAPWVSYLHGPYLNRMNILCAPGRAEERFRLTTDAIDACVDRGLHDGHPVVGMVITSPDNPTGNYLAEGEIAELAEHAVRRGIPHIFLDLIYQMVIDESEVAPYNMRRLLVGLSDRARKAVTVMDGITKSVGASNVRSAHLLTGASELAQRIRAIASHTVHPNALGQAVTLAFYGNDPWCHPWRGRVVGPTDQSRRLFRTRMQGEGFRFIAQQGYYGFVDVGDYLGRLDPANGKPVRTVAELTGYLEERFGVGVVPGDVFRQPRWVRFSVANDPVYTDGAMMRLFKGLSALENP